jgi:hypothetical protein
VEDYSPNARIKKVIGYLIMDGLNGIPKPRRKSKIKNPASDDGVF